MAQDETGYEGASVAYQLQCEYSSAVEALAAANRRDARNKGDFLGEWTSIALAEQEFEAAEKRGFMEWLRLVSAWQTVR